MLDAAEETGEAVPEYLSELVAGVDLEDVDYGMELLKRWLAKHQTVSLWWD